MFLRAPDNIPGATPTPVRQASGWWSSIGALVGLLLDILPVVGPLVPAEYKAYPPVIGTILGFILNRFFHDSYRPIDPLPPPTDLPRP